MDTRSQRSADDLLRRTVDQLLDADPVTGVRQIEAFIADALPYLRAARRAAVYRAKTVDGGMSWTDLARAIDTRPTYLRRIIAQHCRETGDPWPARAGTVNERPRVRYDLRDSGSKH